MIFLDDTSFKKYFKVSCLLYTLKQLMDIYFQALFQGKYWNQFWADIISFPATYQILWVAFETQFKILLQNCQNLITFFCYLKQNVLQNSIGNDLLLWFPSAQFFIFQPCWWCSQLSRMTSDNNFCSAKQCRLLKW